MHLLKMESHYAKGALNFKGSVQCMELIKF